MKEHLISVFIDDELTLNEKIEFVRAVCDRPGFKDATLHLIAQEQWLRSEIVPSEHVPHTGPVRRFGSGLRNLLRPALAAAVVAILAAVLFYPGSGTDPRKVAHRFVVYRPDAGQVFIAGSFSRWEPVPLRKAGSSGYWELTLALPAGEHRFTYLLDGGRMFADPTLPAREQDDFGGVNSVLRVGTG